jgi:hypothetical protein
VPPPSLMRFACSLCFHPLATHAVPFHSTVAGLMSCPASSRGVAGAECFFIRDSNVQSPTLLRCFSKCADRPGRRGWAQRLKIAVDVGRGLNYLHFDRAMPHGNLKATNILLDGLDLNGRVADYCVHRLMTQAARPAWWSRSLTWGCWDTVPPSWQPTRNHPSRTCTVYAFGVVLLELLTGRCVGDVVSASGVIYLHAIKKYGGYIVHAIKKESFETPVCYDLNFCLHTCHSVHHLLEFNNSTVSASGTHTWK